MPRQPVPIRELVESFLDVCRQTRAAATVRFYRCRLKRFVEQFGDRPFSDLTKLEVTRYLTEVGEDASNSTRRHNAVALETLQKFAREQGQLRRRVFRKLDKPAVGKRERLPTEDETRALLRKASPEFRLIYAALRQCGARPGELCGATFEHWDRDAGVIKIAKHKTARKTGKPRVIAVGDKLKKILDQATAGRSEGPLFLSPTGRAWTVGNLSRTYRTLRDRAGLDRTLCLYLTRHEHGTAVCHAHGIHAAAQALGHSSIATTQRYVKTSEEQLRQFQDAFDAAADLDGATAEPDAA